jgi:uncharacterized protein YoxC
MNGSEIAALVAAGGFVLLVLFMAVPILKLGKLLEASSKTISQLGDDLTPLMAEVTKTVVETNKQLVKIDAITNDVSQVTTNISSLVAVFTSSLGSPLAKLAGFGEVIRRFLGKGK